MTFDIFPVHDDDFPRIFELISIAFGHEHPYIEYVYPNHDCPPGRKAGADRMLFVKNADPNTKFIKVVDSGSNRLVGVAKWNIYQNVVPDDASIGGSEWYNGNEQLRDFAQCIYDAYNVPRKEAIRASGGNLVSLDMMVVDPSFQRRNIGRMMVRWGTKIADEMGVKTVVEATNYGVGLYSQEGFKIITFNYETVLPSRFQGWPTQKYHWMERPLYGKEH